MLDETCVNRGAVAVFLPLGCSGTAAVCRVITHLSPCHHVCWCTHNTLNWFDALGLNRRDEALSLPAHARTHCNHHAGLSLAVCPHFTHTLTLTHTHKHTQTYRWFSHRFSLSSVTAQITTTAVSDTSRPRWQTKV